MPGIRAGRRALLLTVALACGGAASTPGAPSGSTTDAGVPDPGACTAGADDCAMVAAHDAVRAAARPAPVPALPALAWSDSAAQAAGAWARQCQWRHDPALGALGLGQNLYASTFRPSSSDVVGSWAAEAADYDLASNTCAAGKVCGHYTQLVWRDTRRVGCATVSCTTGSPFAGGGAWWYVACDYDPPGNFVGQRPY